MRGGGGGAVGATRRPPPPLATEGVTCRASTASSTSSGQLQPIGSSSRSHPSCSRWCSCACSAWCGRPTATGQLQPASPRSRGGGCHRAPAPSARRPAWSAWSHRCGAAPAAPPPAARRRSGPARSRRHERRFRRPRHRRRHPDHRYQACQGFPAYPAYPAVPGVPGVPGASGFSMTSSPTSAAHAGSPTAPCNAGSRSASSIEMTSPVASSQTSTITGTGSGSVPAHAGSPTAPCSAGSRSASSIEMTSPSPAHRHPPSPAPGRTGHHRGRRRRWSDGVAGPASPVQVHDRRTDELAAGVWKWMVRPRSPWTARSATPSTVIVAVSTDPAVKIQWTSPSQGRFSEPFPVQVVVPELPAPPASAAAGATSPIMSRSVVRVDAECSAPPRWGRPGGGPLLRISHVGPLR